MDVGRDVILKIREECVINLNMVAVNERTKCCISKARARAMDDKLHIETKAANQEPVKCGLTNDEAA